MSGRPIFMYEQQQQSQGSKGRSTNNFSSIIRKTEMNLLGFQSKSNPFSGLKQQMSSSIDLSEIASNQQQSQIQQSQISQNSSTISIQDLQKRDEELKKYIQRQIQEGLDRSILEYKNEINESLSKSFYSQQNQNDIQQMQQQQQQDANKFVDVVQEIQKDYTLMKQRISELQQSLSTKELEKQRKQKENEINQLDYSQINDKIKFLESQIASSKDQLNETISQITKEKQSFQQQQQQQLKEQNFNIFQNNQDQQYQQEIQKMIIQTKSELLDKIKNLEDSFLNTSRINTQENFFAADQSMIAPTQQEIQGLKQELQNTQNEINNKLSQVQQQLQEQLKIKEEQKTLNIQPVNNQNHNEVYDSKIKQLEEQLQFQHHKVETLLNKLESNSDQSEKYDKIISLEKNLTKIENQLQIFLNSYEESKTPNYHNQQQQTFKSQEIEAFAEQYKYLQQMQQTEQYNYNQQQQLIQQQQKNSIQKQQQSSQQSETNQNMNQNNTESSQLNQQNLSPIVERTNESSGQKSLSTQKEQKDDGLQNLKNLLKNIKNEEEIQQNSQQLQNLQLEQHSEQATFQESPQLPTQIKYNSDQKNNQKYGSENIFNYQSHNTNSSSKKVETYLSQQYVSVQNISPEKIQQQEKQQEQQEEEKSFQERQYESQKQQYQEQILQHQPEQYVYIKNQQQMQTLDDCNISRSIDFFNIEDKNKNQFNKDDASVNYSYSSFIENENYNDFLGQTDRVSFAQYAQQIEKQFQEKQVIEQSQQQIEKQQQLFKPQQQLNNKKSANENSQTQYPSESIQFQFDFQSNADHQSLYPKTFSIQQQNQQQTFGGQKSLISESQYKDFANDPFGQMKQSDNNINNYPLENSQINQQYQQQDYNQKNNQSPLGKEKENNYEEEMIIGNEDELELSSIQMPNQSFTMFSKSKVDLDEKYLSQYQQFQSQQRNSSDQKATGDEFDDKQNFQQNQNVQSQINSTENEEIQLIQLSQQYDPDENNNQIQLEQQNQQKINSPNKNSPNNKQEMQQQQQSEQSPPKQQLSPNSKENSSNNKQQQQTFQQGPLQMFNMASYSSVDQQLEMIHKQQSQENSFNNNNESLINQYQSHIQKMIENQESQTNQQLEYLQKNNLLKMQENEQEQFIPQLQQMNQSPQQEVSETLNFNNNENIIEYQQQLVIEKEESSNVQVDQAQEFSNNVNFQQQEKTSNNEEEIVYQLDEDGHLIDDNGNYILDDNGQVIKLTSEHIEYLKGEKMLVEEVQQQDSQQIKI